MPKTTNVKRRIAIVTAVLVVAALSYGGWAAWMYHVTFASDADCSAAQAVVKGGEALTDVAGEKSWAGSARSQKDKIKHDRLRTGVTEYITVVDQIFSGPQPNSDARGDAFSDMFEACRDIDVNFPTPRR